MQLISEELGYAECVAEVASTLLWWHMRQDKALTRTYKEILRTELNDMRNLQISGQDAYPDAAGE